MTRPRDYSPEIDLNETVPNLKALSQSPREFDWRQSVADNFDGVRTKLNKIERAVLLIDRKIEDRMLGSIDVAKIVNAEMAKDIQKLRFIERIVYGTVGFVVALAGVIVGKWLTK